MHLMLKIYRLLIECLILDIRVNKDNRLKIFNLLNKQKRELEDSKKRYVEFEREYNEIKKIFRTREKLINKKERSNTKVRSLMNKLNEQERSVRNNYSYLVILNFVNTYIKFIDLVNKFYDENEIIRSRDFYNELFNLKQNFDNKGELLSLIEKRKAQKVKFQEIINQKIEEINQNKQNISILEKLKSILDFQ